ncbi:MAG: poly-gamma-glutamate synthase PgsB [Candidatus Aminicenantes bacterium]
MVSGACFIFIALYLLAERLHVGRKTNRIPLRICVTGTRGKSSVTRLIAASLREAGFNVLAKTTGSKPVLIFPDGKEEEIKRGNLPSILEQKRLVRAGASLGVDALVSEMMSISCESGYVESVQILRPHFLVLTNIRLDHAAQMGQTRQDIARCLASSIPWKSTIFLLQKEMFPLFQARAEEMNSRIVQVSTDSSRDYFPSKKKLSFWEWPDNISLALGVAEFLGIDREVAWRGITRSRPDFGSLKIWQKDYDSPPRSCTLVSCFSANDPESTQLVLSSVLKNKIKEGKKMVGILNFRKDRGDRTCQWRNVLRRGAFPEFSRFYLTGSHAHAFKRRLDSAKKACFVVLEKKPPEKIMEQILAEEKGDLVVVGMGNMGGVGKELVSYWEQKGRRYDL